MVMNISCKFEKASYNIFSLERVMVKSLYTLRWQRRRHNEAKSGGYNSIHIENLTVYREQSFLIA